MAVANRIDQTAEAQTWFKNRFVEQAFRPAWPSERVWHRVRSEFLELPGMSLKVDQAARLFGIDRGDAQVILEGLVGVGFLRRTGVGGYARNDSRP